MAQDLSFLVPARSSTPHRKRKEKSPRDRQQSTSVPFHIQLLISRECPVPNLLLHSIQVHPSNEFDMFGHRQCLTAFFFLGGGRSSVSLDGGVTDFPTSLDTEQIVCSGVFQCPPIRNDQPAPPFGWIEMALNSRVDWGQCPQWMEEI